MIGQREFAAAIGDWSLLPADPRFRIYRANVTSALINALRVRYPVTERLLGHEDFAACAGSYAETQRP
ncbi:MAG: DNA-binding domain-containing protein, partial [Alphaproteobacteria bacterium]|nr:DNA-binding domain-containing protein [Alphaproteobacteria bacterium]